MSEPRSLSARPHLSWIPNGLSLSRLVLGLALPWVPAEWRLAAVVVAGLTDLFDGLLARWLRADSETGRRLDPVADKVFVVVLFAVLLAEGAIGPGWAVAVLARDLAVTAAAAVVAVRGRTADLRRMRPRPLGKLATAAQFVLLVQLVVAGRAWPGLLIPTAVLSLASAVDYAVAYLRGRRPNDVTS